MIAEGYIDVDKAKVLGKLLSVDGIIIGNYTVLSNTIKLTIKALESSTGFVIAASMKDLPLDADAQAILGINGSNNTTNRGFVSPLNSDEQVNNPETVNKECVTKNLGDYCFSNTSKYNIGVELYIYLDDKNNRVDRTMTLAPNQTQCFYNLPSKYIKARYVFKYNEVNGNAYIGYSEGEILIEKCQSKTFTIK